MLKTVLIVEDDSESAKQMTRALRNHPGTAFLTCHTVRSVRSAQLWLEKNPPIALLVTDMFLPADDDAAAKVDELDRKRRDLKMSGEGATLFEARAYVMEQEIQSLTDPLGGFQIVEWLAERDLAFPVIITTAALVTDDVLDFEMRWGHSRLVAESYLRYISKPLPYSAFLSLIESLLAD